MSVEAQYRDDTNLNKRIDLHARFSTNAQGWQRWLFERLAPPAGARILEVGCGPAALWGANLDRIDPTWELTLTDFSAGMIDAARVAFTGDLEAVRAAVAACLERVGTFHIGKSSGVLHARKR